MKRFFKILCKPFPMFLPTGYETRCVSVCDNMRCDFLDIIGGNQRSDSWRKEGKTIKIKKKRMICRNW